MADTLLNYAFLPTPDPLQAGVTATLTLVASNPGRNDVTVTSIVVTLPVGTNARSLTPDATGIQTQLPTGWNASPPSGGSFTLTPTGDAARVGANGVTFLFARVAVNAEPGTTRITIDETAASTSQPIARERSTDVPVDKFPQQFAVSGLNATPLRVDQDGTTTLMWNGTGADYRIYYDPGSGQPVDEPVGTAGPYVATGLVRPAGVNFTLKVSVRVPGQDLPLVVQRQVHVDVAAVTIDDFSASPSTVGENGLTRLSWRTSNAATVTLDPGNLSVPARGVRFVAVAPGQGLFTLTARGSNPKWSAQQQRTVAIDRSIVATEAGWVKVGKKGDDGPNGVTDRSGNGTNGTRGEPGEPVSLTGKIPVLDPSSRPARVLPITLTGGRGGKGGNGGDAVQSCEEQGTPGAGNNGGPGGDATVDATFDETLPPAQYLVTVAGGPGGDKGTGGITRGWGGGKGPDGQAGANGVATVAFHETAARLAALAPGDTSWALQTSPDPLQACAAGATLTVIGTPAPGGWITVTLPIGTGASDLTAHPETLTATAPPGWEVDGRGGAWRFLSTRDAGPAVFMFAGIQVNDQPGVCDVRVGSLALPLAKFPPGFALSPLVATPLRVPSGGAAVLAWSGSPAEYELRRVSVQGEGRQAVANAGSLLARGLQGHPGVFFTLVATLPGGLVIERRVFVEVME